MDLRARVVAAVDGGMSRRQAAERFGGEYSQRRALVRQGAGHRKRLGQDARR